MHFVYVVDVNARKPFHEVNFFSFITAVLAIAILTRKG